MSKNIIARGVAVKNWETTDIVCPLDFILYTTDDGLVLEVLSEYFLNAVDINGIQQLASSENLTLLFD